MSEKTLTMELAEYAVCNHSNLFTADDLRMARLSVLDWIAAAISGKDEECVRQLIALEVAEGAGGSCAVIAQPLKTSPLSAALINGSESHAIDFDDIHDFLSLHLCSPVFPAALAACEQENVSGMEMISASINGMQVMVALSAGIMPEHYNAGRWHATGTLGIFGAAAAAGYILKLSAEQMCNAYGIAAGLCAGIQLNFGTMSKPMCAGMAARNGLMAAMLAKNGFTGRADIFDTDYLGNISTRVDADQIKERLQGPFAIHELRFKRYPCGAPTHSGILNCKKILAEHNIQLDEIEKIVFEPYPRAIRLVGVTHPTTGLQGKFSIPFTAAAQMVFGQVTIETFTDENVHDPRVVQLLDRMEMVPNDEFTYSRGGKVTIYLKDGTSYENSTYLLGHAINLDESDQEVKGKYFEIADPRIGHALAEKLYEAVMQLESMPDLTALSAVL